MTKRVRPKKHLGQHFLTDQQVALDTAKLLSGSGYDKVLEIGPGTGVLTEFLLERQDIELYAIEMDTESVHYLQEQFPDLTPRLREGDFLKMDLNEWLGSPFAIIGNFPYNISSQILFKAWDHRHDVVELAGMFQKEVAKRVASPPGNKDYGILSVLLQAFYKVEYCFTVHEQQFFPPPKVKSGVIHLVRNDVQELECDEKLFKQTVKIAFNQRRKTLRNSLKSMTGKDNALDIPFGHLRAEQLGVEEFIQLTRFLEEQLPTS